jgi:protein TonB
MRRDILLGMILAVLLHFSAALYSHITRTPAPVHGPVDQDNPVARLVLPVDPPEIDPDSETEPPDIKTPPISVDLIDLPGPKDWVIQTEPPRPPVIGSLGLKVIPASIDTSALNRGPYTIAEVDRAPQAVLQVSPAYPATMRAQHVTGQVVVRFVVGANNEVSNVRVVSSSDRAFESAALQAVQKWKFKAGLKGNRPVPVQLEVPINFHLTK